MPGTPHPTSILRGHKAQVHALCFIRQNERLVSGDADGFVVVWDLTIMRPTAVWKPHENAILGIQAWGADRIITHGRDHKLAVWKLSAAEEAGLSTKLPLDDTLEARPSPWLLHLIDVNTMNFCAFASCPPLADSAQDSAKDSAALLVAVPNTLESESIDIYELPSQTRLHTVKAVGKHGMVMALAVTHLAGSLALVAGYEDGLAAVMQLSGDKWTTTYQAQPHTQPILSLDVSSAEGCFFTSSADAFIAKHPFVAAAPMGNSQEGPVKVMNTKHAGQQSLRLRDDGRIFATGGWDTMVRVYSSKSLKEVAALKWHQAGCYAVALADVSLQAPKPPNDGSSTAESREIVPAVGELSVKDRRIQRAMTAHWLAAGSKDGKISLWEVF